MAESDCPPTKGLLIVHIGLSIAGGNIVHLESESPELLERVRKRDQDAFAQLFSMHRRRLKLMLSNRVDPCLLVRTDLSDILQEAYIDAWKRMEHYLAKPELSLYVWLRQITLQRMVDSHRQHISAKKRSLWSEASPPASRLDASLTNSWARQLVVDIASPSQVAIREEMFERVEHVLNSMDSTDREVLVLRHFEELKNNEVAEVLGISVSAASNRYFRALKKLQLSLCRDSSVDAD